MKNITKAYTHAGVFHADDVFSAALLEMLFDEIEIVRTFKVPDQIKDDEIVFDIGGGKFDHHKELEYRDDEKTMPYAAFGLLWREFGHELVSDMGFKTIERELVIPIDKADNGCEFNPLTSFISKLNMSWNDDNKDDPKYLDKRFRLAVWNASSILFTFINRSKSTDAAVKVIEESSDKYKEHFDNHILVLDKYVPWKDICNEMELPIRFAVYPSLRGGYNIESIDSDKYPLPEEWLDELPEGMTFCHLSRFLAATNTLEDAIKYAHVAKVIPNMPEFTSAMNIPSAPSDNYKHRYAFIHHKNNDNVTIGTIGVQCKEYDQFVILPKSVLETALQLLQEHDIFMICD